MDKTKLQAAVEAMVERWDTNLALDVGPNLTCSEADALVEVFRAAGFSLIATAWEIGHAWGDDDEYDEHHEDYLILTSAEG